jgi:hypothetical protein
MIKEMIWKEVVVDEFKVLSWNLTGGIEESHEKTAVSIASLQADI